MNGISDHGGVYGHAVLRDEISDHCAADGQHDGQRLDRPAVRGEREYRDEQA